MGKLLDALCIVFQKYEDTKVINSIRNFKGNLSIRYKGTVYTFCYENNSYILKAEKRVNRGEIEALAAIISSVIGFSPICFYDIHTKENGTTTVNSTIEWITSEEQAAHRINNLPKKSGKVILYPGSGELLIKTWGLNTFNPILFGDPPFINFEERIKKCDEADLYLIIDTLSRYNLCVNDKTWKDRKYNKADINRYYEMAILETNRFIEEFSYPINRDNPSEIVHTKEYFNWFYDWKGYFDENDVVARYLRLKGNNPSYHIKQSTV